MVFLCLVRFVFQLNLVSFFVLIVRSFLNLLSLLHSVIDDYTFYSLLYNDTKPSYKIDQLSERYNEALRKKTQLTLKENDSVKKNLYITWIKSKCFCPSLLTLTNLIVKTKAYQFIALGKTPSILNSTLFDSDAVKLR